MMGTDDFFKKRKAKLQERKRESRTPKPNSFLIVSEGKKTEPLYFDGIANYINKKYGKGIDVEKPLITPKGEGKCTVSLVEAAAEIVALSPIVYNQVWIVFDKDDFKDFDIAIDLAKKYGFGVAWSNQSFEYWIYLHFYFSDSALHRDDWVEKLDKILKENNINPNGYHKNDPNVFEFVREYGSIKTAVESARRIHNRYADTIPSKCDPCTTVYKLILELKPYIEELFI